MENSIKLLIITFLFIISVISCLNQANQVKPIVYFVADTVTTAKNNRVVERGKEEGNKYYLKNFQMVLI